MNAFYVIDKLLELQEQGGSIQPFFTDNEVRNVLVYGMGTVGKHFCEALKKTDVSIMAAFDQKAPQIKGQGDFPVYVPERIREWANQADLLIITPMEYYYDIKEACDKRVDIDIVSVADIMEYVIEGRNMGGGQNESASKATYVNIGRLVSGKLLKGRHILVTGGGSGIGKAIADSFAENGANVVIAGRREERLKDTAEEINQRINGQLVRTVCWDLTDISVIDEKISKSISLMDGLDGIVNSAGIYKELNYEIANEDDFDEVFNINLKGTYFVTNRVAVYMKKRLIQDGGIITIASQAGRLADTGPYALSKSALITYIQGLAYALAPFGIRSNGISPGDTATEMIHRDPMGNIKNESRMGRLIRPEEIAETALFLMSSLSGCINGEIITCNGGNTLRTEYDRIR